MLLKFAALSFSILSLSLSSCGFHLRGMADLPAHFQHVYLVSPPQGRSLQQKLKEELQAYRISYAPSLTRASYQIIIDNLNYTRQISNISSSTTPRQFQLTYTVEYHLTDNHGALLIAPRQLISHRMVSMNSERLLGSNYEEDFFKQEMEQELASQILTNISHYLNHSP